MNSTRLKHKLLVVDSHCEMLSRRSRLTGKTSIQLAKLFANLKLRESLREQILTAERKEKIDLI